MILAILIGVAIELIVLIALIIMARNKLKIKRKIDDERSNLKVEIKNAMKELDINNKQLIKTNIELTEIMKMTADYKQQNKALFMKIPDTSTRIQKCIHDFELVKKSNINNNESDFTSRVQKICINIALPNSFQMKVYNIWKSKIENEENILKSKTDELEKISNINKNAKIALEKNKAIILKLTKRNQDFEKLKNKNKNESDYLSRVNKFQEILDKSERDQFIISIQNAQNILSSKTKESVEIKNKVQVKHDQISRLKTKIDNENDYILQDTRTKKNTDYLEAMILNLIKRNQDFERLKNKNKNESDYLSRINKFQEILDKSERDQLIISIQNAVNILSSKTKESDEIVKEVKLIQNEISRKIKNIEYKNKRILENFNEIIHLNNSEEFINKWEIQNAENILTNKFDKRGAENAENILNSKIVLKSKETAIIKESNSYKRFEKNRDYIDLLKNIHNNEADFLLRYKKIHESLVNTKSQ